MAADGALRAFHGQRGAGTVNGGNATAPLVAGAGGAGGGGGAQTGTGGNGSAGGAGQAEFWF